MAEQPRNRRVWPWIVAAIAVLFVGAFCTLTTVGLALIFGGERGIGGDAIALIRVEGTLIEGEEGTDLFAAGAYSRTIINQIKRAVDDRSVKAIVLRVNSPGGGIVASDDIYREVLRARERSKRVVVSMGTLAASGGYYISAGADRIVASPGTMTGSIGVITIVPNAQELMDKIGVQMTVIKSGPHKDEGSPYRPMTEEEMSYFQSMIDQMYGQFVDIVAKGRNMDVETVRRLADGRVYTGQHALELGLVDELGDLERAIDVAKELGGIRGEPRIIEYQRPSFFDALFSFSARAFPQLSPTRIFETEGRATLQYLYVQ